MADLPIKQGDTDPITLQAAHAGEGAPLAGVSTLKLYMREIGGRVTAPNKIDAYEIESFDEDGTFTWTPQPEHVDQAGTFRLWLHADRSDGTVVHWPGGAAFVIVEITRVYEAVAES